MREFPGPEAKKILENAKKYYATTTVSSRIVAAAGEGAIIKDVDGFEFIDLHCDASVNNLGRNNKGIADAILKQLNTGNIFSESHNAPNPKAVSLAKILCERSPVRQPSKVFFSNSGAEANEAARKLCLAYRWKRKEKQKRRKAIYFQSGFAGRTAGVLPATSSKAEAQRDPFWTETDIEDSIYITYPGQYDNPEKTISEFEKIDLSAVDRILIELPCQGEGGIIPANEMAVKYIYEKTRAAGVLWISDCVQCGMGRTGTLFGCDLYDWLEPDILTLGKALGGGLPIGATIFREYLDFKEGQHSNTFGGGPIVMSAAIEAFWQIEDIIKSGFIKKIESTIYGGLMYAWVKNMNIASKPPRGKGAMWALEFNSKEIRNRVIEVAEELAVSERYGLRILGAGRNSIRIMPPLTISIELLESAMDLLVKTLSDGHRRGFFFFPNMS